MVGVTIALVGDAMFDPIIGSLSDRTRSRLGRRHPYFAPVRAS
jgi:glycoside/pentoside/hexuronide:cation symporter, GPH family